MKFYQWPPNYDCRVIIDGEVRVVPVEKQTEQVQMALTIFTVAGKLKEPVTPRLKAYIKANSIGVEHGTAAV